MAGLVVLGLGALHGTDVRAHFRLVSPEAATVQNAVGDPQKAPPCGGGTDFTGAVTAFRPGETITITIDETVFHPGHYRVVLAVDDPSELPDAPPVTPVGNDACGSTVIDDPPVFPVLADGVLIHDAPFDGEQSFEVTLPDDIACDRCTLQVIEYMSNHPAPCYYYHCATVAIGTDPNRGTETGDGGDGSGDGSTDGDGETGISGPGDGGDASPTSGAGTTTDTASASDTDGPTVGDRGTEDGGGCACSTTRRGGSWASSLGLLALLRLRRVGRRRGARSAA